MSASTTAMDLVRQAVRRELSVEELVAAFLVWEFEPSYKMTGLADDWEFRDNSFEVVQYAFTIDLISERDFARILSRVDGEDIAENRILGLPPSSP